MHLVGELDHATAPQLADAVEEAQRSARLIVLDLRDLAFMDSAGVHAIVDASLAARRGGRRLILVRAPQQVDAVFGLTGMTADVEIFDLDPGEPAVQVLPRLARGSHREA